MNAKKMVAAWRAKFPKIAAAWTEFINAPYSGAADEISGLMSFDPIPTTKYDRLLQASAMKAKHLRDAYKGETFNVGDRVEVRLGAGFSEGSTGVVQSYNRPSPENCAQAAVTQEEMTVYWVLRDRATLAVMYAPWELMKVPEIDRPNTNPWAKFDSEDLKNASGEVIGRHWWPKDEKKKERQVGMPKEMGMPYGQSMKVQVDSRVFKPAYIKIVPKEVFPDVPDGLDNWAMAARIACCSDPCYTVCHGDLTECRTCEQRWDTNDQYPPTCPYSHHRKEPK
jgi:hypothetical protein